jgi:hypothetical protein
VKLLQQLFKGYENIFGQPVPAPGNVTTAEPIVDTALQYETPQPKMRKPYTKSGRPRKPYTYKRGPVPHRKPELLYLYTEAFERLQSFKLAGKELGVTGRAVQYYIQRAGGKVVMRVVYPNAQASIKLTVAEAAGLRWYKPRP